MKGVKGFQKGNKCGGRLPGELDGVRKYLEYLATGAAREYYLNLEKQFAGEILSKPIREAMDRFEKNTEFVTPKLARTMIGTDKDTKLLIELGGGN